MILYLYTSLIRLLNFFKYFQGIRDSQCTSETQYLKIKLWNRLNFLAWLSHCKGVQSTEMIFFGILVNFCFLFRHLLYSLIIFQDLLEFSEGNIKDLGVKNAAHRARIVSSLVALKSKYQKGKSNFFVFKNFIVFRVTIFWKIITGLSCHFSVPIESSSKVYI